MIDILQSYKNWWKRKWSRWKRSNIQLSTHTSMFMILLLGLNFCKKFRPIMTTTRNLRCSLKNFRCSCIFLLTKSRKLLSWSNGMSLKFWGKPRNSQSKASQTFCSTNGCTKQHFGTRLYFKSSCLTLCSPFSLHIQSNMINFDFCSLNKRHSSFTLNIIFCPCWWNIFIYVENIWFTWQEYSSRIMCSQKFSSSLTFMHSHNSCIANKGMWKLQYL